jgi:hypothetical protein
MTKIARDLSSRELLLRMTTYGNLCKLNGNVINCGCSVGLIACKGTAALVCHRLECNALRQTTLEPGASIRDLLVLVDAVDEQMGWECWPEDDGGDVFEDSA